MVAATYERTQKLLAEKTAAADAATAMRRLRRPERRRSRLAKQKLADVDRT